jgi:predicted amidohydrolase YtcJ
MNRLLILACVLWITGCNMSKENVDLLITDATIYTADQDFSTVSAMAIKEGRIVDTGLTNDLEKKYKPTSTLSFKGKFIYPGWIDAHCHFFGYGMNLSAVDVAGTTSVEEIIGMLKIHQEKNHGDWITGRGWDQNDWDIQEFPDRTMLDKHFPNTPILLRRIDGHAAWANTLALKMAGVTSQSNVEGGTVMVKHGEPTGILIDNAIGLVGSLIPEATQAEILMALELAERNCFSVGLTSVQDAGLSRKVVELIDDRYKQDALKIRINAWLSPTQENFKHFV